jgi:hypothetical protein
MHTSHMNTLERTCASESKKMELSKPEGCQVVFGVKALRSAAKQRHKFQHFRRGAPTPRDRTSQSLAWLIMALHLIAE